MIGILEDYIDYCYEHLIRIDFKKSYKAWQYCRKTDHNFYHECFFNPFMNQIH